MARLAAAITLPIRESVDAALADARTDLAPYQQGDTPVLPAVEVDRIEREVAATHKVTHATVLAAVRDMARRGALDMVCLGEGVVWRAVPDEDAEVEWVRVPGKGGVPTLRQLTASRQAGIGWVRLTEPAQVYSPIREFPGGGVERLATMLTRPKPYLHDWGVGSRTAFIVDRSDLDAFVAGALA